MRTMLPIGLILVAASACTSSEPQVACTAIGGPPGIDITVDPAILPKADTGTVQVCWNDACGVHPIAFNKMPDTYADIPGLPKREVEVTVQILDQSGAETLGKTLTATPVPIYPNGRACGALGPRLALVVDADGTVRTTPPRSS